MKAPIHCKKPMELRAASVQDIHTYLEFQCKKCGEVKEIEYE